MDGDCTYQYNQETKILHKTYHGKFHYEDIVESWEHAKNNHLIPSDIEGLLIDYSEGELCLKMGDERKVSQYYYEKFQYLKGKRMAIVVKTPQEIIFPMLMESKPKTFIPKSFSTKTAAINWLLDRNK